MKQRPWTILFRHVKTPQFIEISTLANKTNTASLAKLYIYSKVQTAISWKYSISEFVIVILIAVHAISSGELIYTPVNPSFGGSPLNAQWLISSAQAQNSYTESSSSGLSSRSPVESFKESLNRQILSRFASQIVSTAFGEGGTDPLVAGSYQIGDFSIEVTPNSQTISIIVIDNVDGSETVIEIPYYGDDLSQ